MAKMNSLSEAETLELYRVALNNTENQPEIANAMAEKGYDASVISQGKDLLAKARQLFDANRIEDNETSAAYSNFAHAKDALEATYGVHRKLAKVVFKNDGVTLERLGILGRIPRPYTSWMEKVKTFYSEVVADSALQSQLSRLNISIDEINTGESQIAVLETARENYLREKGESQEATKAKDGALEAIEDWMSDFYRVAKVALVNKSQLLESIGKLVRG